jgi:hypothetical protein
MIWAPGRVPVTGAVVAGFLDPSALSGTRGNRILDLRGNRAGTAIPMESTTTAGFPAGRPTGLVRDEGIESRDEPPPGAPPAPLVPAVAGQVIIGSPARPRGVPRAVRIAGVVALVAAPGYSRCLVPACSGIQPGVEQRVKRLPGCCRGRRVSLRAGSGACGGRWSRPSSRPRHRGRRRAPRSRACGCWASWSPNAGSRSPS